MFWKITPYVPENSCRKYGQGVEQRLDEVIFLTGKPEKRV